MRLWNRITRRLSAAATLLALPALALTWFAGSAWQALAAAAPARPQLVASHQEATAAPVDADDADLNAWDETATANPLATAQAQQRSLQNSLNRLNASKKKVVAGSLADTLLRQRIQVTQAELNALHRVVVLIHNRTLIGLLALNRLGQLQAKFSATNVALTVFQSQEIVQGHSSPFSFSSSF